MICTWSHVICSGILRCRRPRLAGPVSPPALAEQGTWRRASGSSVSSMGYGTCTENKRAPPCRLVPMNGYLRRSSPSQGLLHIAFSISQLAFSAKARSAFMFLLNWPVKCWSTLTNASLILSANKTSSCLKGSNHAFGAAVGWVTGASECPRWSLKVDSVRLWYLCYCWHAAAWLVATCKRMHQQNTYQTLAVSNTLSQNV